MEAGEVGVKTLEAFQKHYKQNCQMIGLFHIQACLSVIKALAQRFSPSSPSPGSHHIAKWFFSFLKAIYGEHGKTVTKHIIIKLWPVIRRCCSMEEEQTHSKALHSKMGRSAEMRGYEFSPASLVDNCLASVCNLAPRWLCGHPWRRCQQCGPSQC